MSNVSQKTIDIKLRFINSTIEKIKRGTATTPEIDKACDMIHWLWKWNVIDRDKSCELAEKIADAMEGKSDEE